MALISLTAATALLVALLLFRPGMTGRRGGKMLAFVAPLVMPILSVAGGTSHHLTTSQTTAFCVACHEMQPYRDSLDLADLEHVPAAHWQKRLVPRERACFTCHTRYAMFGDLEAKIAGLKHLWVHYFGEIPDRIELYEPYSDRECLHCHEGARNFLEAESHEDAWEEMRSGEVTCLECHEKGHAVHDLGRLERWTPGEKR